MTTDTYDLAVIGGGIHGASTALFAARAGMRVVLFDAGALCRAASGTNAGTLTMQMTRAALIPFALKAHEMWVNASQWLGHDVGVVSCDGLSLAFTEREEKMLAERAEARGAAGAPIRLITPKEACAVEPSVNPDMRMASHCTIDGYANAYLTGQAFHRALTEAGVTLREYTPVEGIEPTGKGYDLRLGGSIESHVAHAGQIALTGGVWLQPMMAMLGLHLPIKTLTNQLAVTERSAPMMRTVVCIASGLLSLKQFPHGTTVIGGGWQGAGDRDTNSHRATTESMIGNVRLAVQAIPKLRQTRIVRSWTGFESETADALPAVGPIPGFDGAWICGAVHSGYTSAPYTAQCLTQAILGQEPDMPLFPIDRLLNSVSSEPKRNDI